MRKLLASVTATAILALAGCAERDAESPISQAPTTQDTTAEATAEQQADEAARQAEAEAARQAEADRQAQEQQLAEFYEAAARAEELRVAEAFETLARVEAEQAAEAARQAEAERQAEAARQTCPNGTYINVDGNEVCRPFASPSTPAGATAQCRDGTYSFSQNRSGTCSHHGGVAQWL